MRTMLVIPSDAKAAEGFKARAFFCAFRAAEYAARCQGEIVR